MVSVIVVTWNRRDLLRACLQSIEAPTAAQYEVIVVDNGSADGSPEMVEREFPAARLIRNRENRGFCAANNQGIAASQAEYIALLNNDAEAAPGCPAALLGAIATRPDRRLVVRICPGRGRAAPSRRDARLAIRTPAGADRAQPGVARGQAFSMEPVVDEPRLLPGEARVRHLGGGAWPWRNGRISRSDGKVDDCAGADPRRLPGSAAAAPHAAQAPGDRAHPQTFAAPGAGPDFGKWNLLARVERPLHSASSSSLAPTLPAPARRML